MALKEIPGSAGFLADEEGNVYSPNGERRNTYRNGDGYHTVAIQKEDGRWVTYGVHRLIARTHVPKGDVFVCDQVNHRDSDLDNNRAINLEWVSAIENNIHSEIMRTDNIYPCVLAYDAEGNCVGMYLNAHHAAAEKGVHPLDVWDSLRWSVEVNGVVFKHRGFDYKIPTEFKKPTIHDRDDNGRPPARSLKMLDIQSGEIRIFHSFAEAAKEFGISASHLHQSIPRHGKVRVFKKRYQVAYLEDDFPEISEEELERALNHGPREVLAYNAEHVKFVIFGSAKQFVEDSGLSKKAVTTALKNGTMRTLGVWKGFVYATSANVRKLHEYAGSPVSAETN